MADGNHHHGAGCQCPPCGLHRNFEYADDELNHAAKLIELALRAAGATGADVDANPHINRHDDVNGRLEFRFLLLDLPIEESRRMAHTVARLFHGIADEIEQAAQLHAVRTQRVAG